MTPAAVGLVLTGSVAHATWNVLVKRAPVGGPVFVWAYSLLSLVLLVPVAVVVVGRGDGPGPAVLGASAVSAVLHLGYALALQRAYARADMNVAYPVARGVGPVLVVLFAVTVLGERVGGLALAGVGAVVVGVLVVASGSAAGSGPPAAAHDRGLPRGAPAGVAVGPDGAGAARPSRRRSGALHGVGVGAAIAAYTLWDDHAVNVLDVAVLPYYVGASAVQCVLLTVVCWRRRSDVVDVLRVSGRTALGVALLVPTSYLLVLLAMQQAPVALVAPLRATSIVLGSLAGWLVLGERSGARRLAGAAVVLAGVVALLAG